MVNIMFNFLIILLAISPTVIRAFDATTPENLELVRNLIEQLDPIVAKDQSISFFDVCDKASALNSKFSPENAADLFLEIIQHYSSK
jgi:hypothetical protein